MSLKELIKTIELNLGEFSKHYKTQSGNGRSLKNSQKIAFTNKPAQQLLRQCGGDENSKSLLTTRNTQIEFNKTLSVRSFFDKDPLPQLDITSSCLNKLLDSAKVYINTSIFPAGLYAKILGDDTNPINHELQNQAVGVCHAQLVYPLTRAVKENKGKSINTPYSGEINENTPGILLLSSPRLNFKDGFTDSLSEEQYVDYIEGMYRNLFQATLSEGREYLAMPAAGIGKSGGSPELYFSALVKVAREFPELNIIYHPSSHEKEFFTILKKADLPNIAMATKDIIAIAQSLTQQQKSCALHIPCSTDVIFGRCDVGGHWKNAKDNQFTLQEFIGSMTTAPLNSYGFNPKAYQTLIERPLIAQIKEIPKLNLPEPTHSTESKRSPEITSKPTTPRNTTKELPPTPKSKKTDSFFKPEKTKFALSLEHSRDINQLIHALQSEVTSCWPYPNKALKLEKIDALTLLITKAEEMPLVDAITQIKTLYPRVADGYFSTRASDLLNKLALNNTSEILSI